MLEALLKLHDSTQTHAYDEPVQMNSHPVHVCAGTGFAMFAELSVSEIFLVEP